MDLQTEKIELVDLANYQSSIFKFENGYHW